MITYDTKLFEQQQWQRKSQVSGHKKRDRAHLVHSPHLLLTGSVQGWSLLALLHGLLGKGSMQTWKKSIQRGKEEQPLQGSCKFKWLQHHWLRDSGWFLMILGGSCNSILLLHILHGQERHKRCSASRDPHWPAAQLLRFPREWGPERKPGCGWLPVNSMYQSEGESILQLWAPNGITLVPSCHRLSEENLCKTWSIACTDMQGNVLIGTYRCCPKPGPLRLTCKCPTRFPERLLLSPVRAKTCQDYSRKSKNQPVPHMSWTEITGLNSMTKRSLIIGLSSLLPVVVAACIRPAIHTAGTANTFTIAIGNQCL